MIPLGFALVYLAYVFSFTDLGERGRASSFPAWMFTLPARTSTLILWPMLSGAVVFAAIWIAATRFLFWPAELDVPMWWPALALAATVMWLQALDWSPLGLWLKALLAVGVLAGLWVGLLMTEARLDHVLLLGGFVPTAFVAAWLSVSRARRGGLTAWTGWRKVGEWGAAVLPRRRRPFDSPAAAQFWMEWRQNGVLLPLMVGCWLLFLAGLIPFSQPISITSALLVTAVYLLPFFAPLVGCVFGKPEVMVRHFRFSTFAVARPMTSGSMALAKLLATALGLLIAWGMLFAAIVLWFTFTDGLEDAARQFFSARDRGDSLRVAQLIGLAVLSLMGFSALQLCGHCFAGLSGRVWVFAGVIVLYLVGVPNLFALHMKHQHDVASSSFYAKVMDMLPALARFAVLLKLLAASWAFYTAWQSGMMTLRQILGIIGVWLFVVGTLISLIDLAFPPGVLRLEYVFLGVILALPLARLAAAPLALAWNRHR